MSRELTRGSPNTSPVKYHRGLLWLGAAVTPASKWHVVVLIKGGRDRRVCDPLIIVRGLLLSPLFTAVVCADCLSQGVQFRRSVVSDSLQPHGLQHTRLPSHHQLPEPAQTHVHRAGDAIRPSHPLIPFSRLQSFPASGSFPVTQFFTSGGQRIGVSASASVLPINIQD